MKPREEVLQARFSIRDISEKAGRMEDVVRLDIGQPDFDTPDVVKEKVKESMENEVFGYTSLWGMPELREEIADYESGKFDIDPGNVMVTTGGIGGLYTVLTTLLDSGDKVLMNDPAWSPYSLIARVSPGRLDQVPYVRDGELDVEGIREAVDDDTKLLLLNSPENPTGRVYTEEELKAIGELAEEEDLHVISDEVYDHIHYGGEHVSIAEFYPERTILVNSTSKNFAMTGWRVGWVAARDEELVHELGKTNRASTACPNYAGQKAALAALRHAQDYTRR